MSQRLENSLQPDVVGSIEMLVGIYYEFLRYYPQETRLGMHVILASKIMLDVHSYIKSTGGLSHVYRRDVKLTVYPERRLLIVSGRFATSEPAFSVDIAFADLLEELDGVVSEERLVACLAPFIQQTTDAMAEVRALMADLKLHNS